MARSKKRIEQMAEEVFDHVVESLGMYVPADATEEEVRKMFDEKRKTKEKEKDDARNQGAK